MKRLLYFIFLMIFIMSCERPVQGPNDEYVRIKFISSIGEYLSDSIILKELDPNTKEIYRAPSMYRIKIITKFEENIVDTYWYYNDKLPIWFDKEGHKWIGISVRLHDWYPEYELNIEFFCPDIFKDEEYHTMTFTYSKAERNSYKLNTYLFDNVAGKIENRGINDIPIIVFTVPETL